MNGLLSKDIVNISSIDSHTILLWAGLGFAYCYLASAPILVLHATRGAGKLFQTFLKDEKSKLVVLITVIVIVLVIAFSIFYLNLRIGEIVAYCLVLMIIGLQFAFIYLGQKNDGKAINEFYKKLITERSTESPAREKYIESYKHLREHGNAFFIIVLEFILAFSIWHAEKLEHLYILLLIWAIPAAWVWFIGTKMESKIDMF